MVNLLVLIFGTGLIIFILWFFFGNKKTEKTIFEKAKRIQEITVVVESGYQPNKISAVKNIPLTITFDRKDRGECTDRVIFPKMKIRNESGQIIEKAIVVKLPENTKTPITFIPMELGVFEFMCGMGMVHGKLEVE